jgi:hypothetical protein
VILARTDIFLPFVLKLPGGLARSVSTFATNVRAHGPHSLGRRLYGCEDCQHHKVRHIDLINVLSTAMITFTERYLTASVDTLWDTL